MARHGAVERAVLEQLLTDDDAQAWHSMWVLAEDLYGTRVTARQHAAVVTGLHRLHDEGVVQFRRGGPAQHVITVRLDPTYRMDIARAISGPSSRVRTSA